MEICFSIVLLYIGIIQAGRLLALVKDYFADAYLGDVSVMLTRHLAERLCMFVLIGPKEELKMLKSVTIIENGSDRLSNPTPGDILLEEFLKPMGLSQNQLGVAIGVSPRRINEIVLGKRSVTADTSLRLGRYFGLSDGYWLRLQNAYDLDEQRRKIGPALAAIVQYAA
jgi:antitoxin HigA-1